MTVDPIKVKAILEWQAPTSVKGVRSFLGFANFYRCFVNNFAEIAAPLNNLTNKNTAWQWGEPESRAFERLKKIFASEPVLAQWDPDRETLMESDCSGYALGGCLSQRDGDGVIRPVAYYSRRLNGAEVNYQSCANPFTINTYHKNLNFFTTKRLLYERQVRYNDLLQQF